MNISPPGSARYRAMEHAQRHKHGYVESVRDPVTRTGERAKANLDDVVGAVSNCDLPSSRPKCFAIARRAGAAVGLG